MLPPLIAVTGKHIIEPTLRIGSRAGDKPIGALVDGDVVSAVEFDEQGEYLATGDRGGRVRIYQRAEVGPTVSWALETCQVVLVTLRIEY